MSPPPLSDLTTLHLGGPPRQLIEATDDASLIAAVRDGAFVLAGGSNVVFADAGYDGTVVLVRTRGIERDGYRLTVAAGHDWDDLVAYSVEHGLAGIECLSGIPGSTGATPIQNVGAYGQEVAQTISSVRVFDREQDAVVDLPASECGFGYRASRFKYHDRWVVLSVTFDLHDQPSPITYFDAPDDLAGRRAVVLDLRRSKGMVVDPADPDSVSAGSFFTNPILDAVPEGAPAWPEPDGRLKTSAAWLIGQAGIERGQAVGGAAISSKHLLALTNRGGTTEDLLALARVARDAVRERFGIELHPEPVLVGVSL